MNLILKNKNNFDYVLGYCLFKICERIIINTIDNLKLLKYTTLSISVKLLTWNIPNLSNYGFCVYHYKNKLCEYLLYRNQLNF